MFDKSWGKQLNCDVVLYQFRKARDATYANKFNANNCIQDREGLLAAQNDPLRYIARPSNSLNFILFSLRRNT